MMKRLEEETMKRDLAFIVVSLALVIGLSGGVSAEVKTVQMKIAGYLCGN
ncbi:MAG: hypothetical protein WBV94_16635 [Blastocatellia bacterium]